MLQCKKVLDTSASFSIFQLQPESTEEYIDYLVSIDKLDEAAIRLALIINNEDFVSKKGKSKHQVCQTFKMIMETKSLSG